MPVPPDRAWQLPWLRLHLFMRDVLATPWGKDCIPSWSSFCFRTVCQTTTPVSGPPLSRSGHLH
jgi:hypothetical protein